MTLFFPLQLGSIKLVEGGLYISPSTTGKLQAIKILKLDDYGAHLAMYQNQYLGFPEHIDESTLCFGSSPRDNRILIIGHLPISYATLQSYKLLFVQASYVKEDEFDGYNMWLDAQGGYF